MKSGERYTVIGYSRKRAYSFMRRLRNAFLNKQQFFNITKEMSSSTNDTWKLISECILKWANLSSSNKDIDVRIQAKYIIEICEHKRLKPFEYEICDKSFGETFNLRRHF